MALNSDFEHMILSWIVQTNNKDILTKLKKGYFHDPEHKKLYDVLTKHVKTYNNIPNFSILADYYPDDSDWSELCHDLVLPVDDQKYIETKIDQHIKQESLKELLTRYLPDIKDGKDRFPQLLTGLEEISAMSSTADNFEGVFLEDSVIDLQAAVGHPTFIDSLNAMTSAGGFYSPQLVIFLGGPKSFKTGLLINLAVEYAYDGMRVFYADFENGIAEMQVRQQQCVLKCTEEDLDSKAMRKKWMTERKVMAANGGSLYIRSFIARKDTMRTVESEIDRLIKQKKWKPDVIVIDYLDIVGSANVSKDMQRRLSIQDNYLTAVSLNKKYGAFTFSISKVKQSAYDKKDFSISDFGEDAEKVYNAHAAFAFMRDEDDHKFHRARIAPLVQRRGKSYGKDDCWLGIDETRQLIWEEEPDLF